MSINAENLPENAVKGEKLTYRTINIDGEEFEFSKGFTELHTESYKNILAGNGFGIEDARNAINIVYDIRHAEPIGLKGDYHRWRNYLYPSILLVGNLRQMISSCLLLGSY